MLRRHYPALSDIQQKFRSFMISLLPLFSFLRKKGYYSRDRQHLKILKVWQTTLQQTR